MGTVDYMAPEQADDPRRPTTGRTSTGSGCTLHYLLTGKAPYGGQTFMQRLLAHRERPIPSLLDARKDVSAKLDAVFRRARGQVAGGTTANHGTGDCGTRVVPAVAPGGENETSRPRKRSEDDEDDPGSVYEFAGDGQAREARRSETAGSVFVRSRGSERRQGDRTERSKETTKTMAYRGSHSAELVAAWSCQRR